MKKKLPPVHPGEILNEEFLKPLQLSQSQLARDLRIPHRRINEIVLGKRSISPDTALRLSVYFNTSPELWMNLQTTYELRLLQYQSGAKYQKLPHYHQAA